MEDGSVWGVGANKAGQCGVKSSVDTIPNYKKCPIPDDVTIIQVCIDNYCDDIAPLVRMERR
jgi:alpha-tubulin suppressor-like RCC1 family protein